MVNTLYAGMRLLNGLTTIFLAYPLYQISMRTRRNFYKYWSVGFALYGVSIIMRIPTIDSREITTLALVSYLLLLMGLFSIIAGIGDLVGQARRFLLAILILPGILGILIVADMEWVDFGLAVALAPYVFITASLMYLKINYNSDIILLLTGWTNILMLNFAYIYGYMNEGYVDFMSLITKVVIYIGMTNPSFSFLYEDLTRFLLGGVPEEYSDERHGEFNLVDLKTLNKNQDIQWLNSRIKLNDTRGKRTILVVLYDQIVSSDIFNEDNQGSLFIVRMLIGQSKRVSTFEEPVITINDDFSLLEILFTDIVSFSKDKFVPCEVILYTLSQMFHSHGHRRIYSFLTSKMNLIKSSMVSLTGFYAPDSHEIKSDMKMIETLADNIINS